MPSHTKGSGITEIIRKFVMGFQLISSLVLGIFVIIVLYFALKYFDIPLYTAEQVAEAQKTGNWVFPDNNYVLKNFETISLGNKSIGEVTVRDKKSGNTIMIFDVSFTQKEVLKLKDYFENKLLEKYELSNYYLRRSGNRIGGIGEEFVYSTVGWNSDGSNRLGIIGNLDCIKNRSSGSNIYAVVYNDPAKYNEARALGFINGLKCPPSLNVGPADSGAGDKIDTDNDGLPDEVEKMLGTDPYKADTNDNGINDFEEIQQGYNPSLPRPWSKYTAEEFAKVKKDIQYISLKNGLDTYDKLFGGK